MSYKIRNDDGTPKNRTVTRKKLQFADMTRKKYTSKFKTKVVLETGSKFARYAGAEMGSVNPNYCVQI